MTQQFNDRDIEKHSLTCLALILNQAKEVINGLRDFQEIQAIVQDACNVRNEDPQIHYKLLGKIG